MSRFIVHETALPGLKVVERLAIADERGFLARLFCAADLHEAGWVKPVAQINHTMTCAAGAVRGMHYQRPPHAEMKLVSCVRGRVFDVAVDLRRGSPTFLGWHGEILSAANRRALLIPEGFAHGFQVLEPDSELIYLHSAAYHPASEGAVNPEDARVSIAWPEPVTEMSARDRAHPPLGPDFEGIVL